MRSLCVGLLSTALLMIPSEVPACTIFASHKGAIPYAGKIRDTKNHHRQELKVIYPERELGETEAYFGLFAVDGAESITFSPLKMGVNERGVFIGFATPSSVPYSLRRNLPFFKDLTHHLLTRAKTAREAVEIMARQEQPLGLRIMVLADAKESFLMENGTGSESLVQVRSELATNHFRSPVLRHLNSQPIADSLRRFELAARRLPFLDFLSPPENGAVLNSLWVAPTSKKSTYTRSDFVVYYPPGQSPIVKVRMENSGKVDAAEWSLKSLFSAKACPAHLLKPG